MSSLSELPYKRVIGSEYARELAQQSLLRALGNAVSFFPIGERHIEENRRNIWEVKIGISIMGRTLIYKILIDGETENNIGLELIE